MTRDEQRITAVAGTLVLAYGIQPAEVTQIPAGTATFNYRVTGRDGEQWFAKVYRDRSLVEQERAAVELSEFARDGHLPVPPVCRTREGDLVEVRGRLPMSLWPFVPHTQTAEGNVTGARWAAVGTVVGHLHRRLAEHPAASPVLRPGSAVCDVGKARIRFERLVAEYRSKPQLTAFETWALEAARERQPLLEQVDQMLTRLPDLTVQVLHGDLASPNVLLDGDEVAAIVDFQPPRPRYLSWEIARIGCDPKGVLAQSPDTWLAGLVQLALAYRATNPKTPVEDIVSTVRVGCAAMLTSTYPLSAPIEEPSTVDAALESYGRSRHAAALVLLERLDETEEALRDCLY